MSPDSWGAYFLSKHHYAIELSKENNVFFLNAFNADSVNGSNEKVNTQHNNTFTVLNLQNRYKGIGYYPVFLQKQLYKSIAQKLINDLPKLDIVWSFDLHRFPDLKVFNADLSIFHPVDLYKSKIVFDAAQSADIVFATAPSIIARLGLGSKPAYTINHGLADSFLEESVAPNDIKLPGSNNIKTCLIGNPVHKHVSQVTLLEIVKTHSDVDFYFIGQVKINKEISRSNLALFEQIEACDNTFYLGRKEYWQLKSYMELMDVLLICYDRENYDEAPPNPHKMLEYLSVGKPIVSNYFEVYNDAKDLINMASSLEEYSALFKETIAQLAYYSQEELASKRKTLAASNTYGKQLERIAGRLSENHLLP